MIVEKLCPSCKKMVKICEEDLIDDEDPDGTIAEHSSICIKSYLKEAGLTEQAIKDYMTAIKIKREYKFGIDINE